MKQLTAETTFIDLCEQVDFWKSEAEYWKQQFEQERDENNRQLTQRLEDSQKQIGQTLALALSLTEDNEGNLIINKSERKNLSKRFKK